MGEAARCFGGLLRVHSAVEHAVEKMGLPNSLIMAAHNAEGHDCTTVLAQHAGNDRVQRPLPGRDCVRMACDELKARAAVVQQHAAFRRKDSAAEGEKEGVY